MPETKASGGMDHFPITACTTRTPVEGNYRQSDIPHQDRHGFHLRGRKAWFCEDVKNNRSQVIPSKSHVLCRSGIIHFVKENTRQDCNAAGEGIVFLDFMSTKQNGFKIGKHSENWKKMFELIFYSFCLSLRGI